MKNKCTVCGRSLSKNGECLTCKCRKDPLFGETLSGKKKKSIKILCVFAAICIAVTAVILGAAYGVYEGFIDLSFLEKETETTTAATTEAASEEESQSTTEAPEEIPSEEVPSEEESTDIYQIPVPDYGEYFEENGKSIKVTDFFDSESVRSGETVVADFEERGFTGPVTSDYDTDGKITEEFTIDHYWNADHPVYKTFYVSSKNDLWMITEINGSVFASPVFYNNSHPDKPAVIISETDTVTGYDSTDTSFYTMKPDSDFIKLITVERIDISVLEVYTEKEIEKA